MTENELSEAAQKVRTADEAVALLWPLIEAKLIDQGIDVSDDTDSAVTVGIRMYKKLALTSWAGPAVNDSICDRFGEGVGNSLLWKVEGQVQYIIQCIQRYEKAGLPAGKLRDKAD